ncbi:hypothetical protein POTOM_019542 [Populus tomentosa]|uniref:Uncharacterized protein n=1 Tax=Populus tomentosa TaxID=118781 RepID=A0A8X7ZUA3_POPTO|nr:hypothetical protein POTOM_019542 [Populus tomentosa]
MAIIIDGHGDKKDCQVDDNECKITRFSSSPTRTGFKERGLDNGKQWLLYSLLDAVQPVTSQAVLVGVSCRLNGSVSENPLDAEIGSFFDSAPPLKDCDGIAKKLKDFIEFNSPPPGKKLAHLLVFNQVLTVLIRKEMQEKGVLRGTFQPYCRSLPEDPLLECFECSDDSAVQGFSSSSSFPAEHKIQSASGPLDMRLVQVPKMLSALKKAWAPMAFCISFKVR